MIEIRGFVVGVDEAHRHLKIMFLKDYHELVPARSSRARANGSSGLDPAQRDPAAAELLNKVARMTEAATHGSQYSPISPCQKYAVLKYKKTTYVSCENGWAPVPIRDLLNRAVIAQINVIPYQYGDRSGVYLPIVKLSLDSDAFN